MKNSQKTLLVGISLLFVALGYFGMTTRAKLNKQIASPEIVPSPENTTPKTYGIKTYINSRYNFQFQYPGDFFLLSNEMETANTGINTTSFLTVYSGTLGLNNTHAEFEIQVFPLSATKSNSNVKDYAEAIWLLNKNDKNPNIHDKKVGSLNPVVVDGHQAYAFDVTTSFKNEGGGHLLNEETTFVFVEENSKVYTIDFPKNRLHSQKIFETFKFNK